MTRKKWNILSFIVLMSVAFLVFNRNNIVSLFDESLKSEISVKKVQSYNLASLKSADSVYASDNRYYFYYNNKVTCYGLDGSEIWNKEFKGEVTFMKSPVGILIVEKNNGNVYLFDENGELQNSILGLGEVNFAEFSIDGRCVIRLNDNKSILIYDKHMNKIADVIIGDGTIIDHNINFDTDRISILVLKDIKGEISSEVLVVGMDGKTIHKKAYNEKLLSILTNYDGYLFLYKNKVALYNSNLKEKRSKRVNVHDIRYFNFTPNSIIIINDESKNNVENNYYFKTYDINENKIGINAKIDVKYNKIVFKDGIFVAVVDNRIDLYNQSGTLIYTKEQKGQIENLFILDEGHLLVLEENLLTLYEIVK